MPQFDTTDRSSPGWAERLTASMAESEAHSKQLAAVDAENEKLRKRIAELEEQI